jgi:hypothetical protein
VRDSCIFEEMKCLLSIAPEARKGDKSSECLSLKNFNWTLDRTRFRVDLRVRSVQTTGRDARVKVTDGASGPSWNQRVRSRTQWAALVLVPIGHGGASGHVRPDASDRARSSLDSDQTSGAARPVKRCSAFGHDNGSL